MFGFEFDEIDKLFADNLYESTAFKEFSDVLDQLDQLYEMAVYDEAVGYRDDHKTRGMVAKNTKDTIKKTAGVYGDVTDVGGSILKASFDLVMSGIRLITKACVFISQKIVIIPQTITKSIDYVSKIPRNISTKIKGNIQLYITAEDVDAMYNKMILSRLMSFMSNVEVLSTGETWSTLFKQRNVSQQMNDGSYIEFKQNDMETCKKLKQDFSYFQSMKFEQTVVDLNNGRNVRIYFSNDKSIQFNDLRGRQHHYSYYDALKQLVGDINGNLDVLNKLYASIGSKMEKSQLNNTYGRLSASSQKLLNETIQMISKTIVLLGNIVRYTITDMNTIQNSVKSISKKWDVDADVV